MYLYYYKYIPILVLILSPIFNQIGMTQNIILVTSYINIVQNYLTKA